MISITKLQWGGFYGPTIWSYFDQQNKRILAQDQDECEDTNSDTILKLDTLGLLQGCVDQLLESPYYPQIAFNNTYNFPVISETTYFNALNESIGPGGVQDKIRQCRTLAAQDNPEFNSDNALVNGVCAEALLGNSGQIEILGSDFDNSDVNTPLRKSRLL
jgi:hypothetical protein